MPLQEYLERYHPRRDLYDGTPISFRGDIDRYFLTDFNSPSNLRIALTSWPKEKAKAWVLDILKRRKKVKGMQWCPMEVELRTLGFPPTSFLNKLFNSEGGVYKAFQLELGVKIRFEALNVGFRFPNDGETTVLVDTRETKPLDLPGVNIEVAKLDYGDYCAKIFPQVFFERKSLSDLLGTFSKGYERFIREVDRAEGDGAYLVVLVEVPLRTFLKFDELPLFTKVSKATPEFIGHRIRECLQERQNLQFLFCEGRKDAATTLVRLVRADNLVKRIDLQHARATRAL